ncbi:DNA/RNA non-specific endonuclease [Maribacter aurantiacus]|uniref:Endonuclease n=1 Tax=Maribacter aurantiacus TaxID=1882343 RepID=A0A5R8MBM0_9FLAO|nr:DNA/RNA non-specific endonuclease [Maribacter aurantiacus]TLF46954.1 DNA/RNA non-specific endonuclease [Maribacter aurantiacus]
MSRYRKNSTIYSILIVICIVGFWVFENFYTPDTYSRNNDENGASSFPLEYLPSSTTGDIVHHSYYSLSYNEPFEQAEWVAYELDKKHLTYDDRDRPYFIEDPYVKSKSADWRNYRGSGYDRGHLCPAGDRRFSEQAYNETFYTSNISPQDKDFNAGVWNRLEMQIRQWTKRYGKVIVITGGVLEPGLQEIGEEAVDVPKKFYKIVARKEGDRLKILGFLIPGVEQQRPLESFCVAVDSIESLTGIDFFKELNTGLAETLESSVASHDWKF